MESETHLVQQATGLRALAGVMSLPSVDDRLLEEAAARCQGIALSDRPRPWPRSGPGPKTVSS